MITINILFFLTPKAEVAHIEENFNLRQVLEKMEFHKYSAIPILNADGEYIGTITEGDLLWFFRHGTGSAILEHPESLGLEEVPRRLDYAPVNASSNMEDLLSKITQQNFVPVVDDCDIFIGIIKRRDVIDYLSKRLENYTKKGDN